MWIKLNLLLQDTCHEYACLRKTTLNSSNQGKLHQNIFDYQI